MVNVKVCHKQTDKQSNRQTKNDKNYYPKDVNRGVRDRWDIKSLNQLRNVLKTF